MSRVDPMAAAFAGFDVIKRDPIAPAIWGLVQGVLTIGPLLLFYPVIGELYRSMLSGGFSGGDQAQFDQMMAANAQMTAYTPISYLAQALTIGLLYGAVFRAVLSPPDKRWFFMRFSMAEVMLLAVTIVFYILVVLAMILAMVVVAIIGFALYAAVKDVGILIAVLLGVGVLGAFIWASLRLAMALPMSFDRKTFLLFESWKVTEGHALSLFLMALVNFIFVMFVQLILVGAGFAILAFTVLNGVDFSQFRNNPAAIFEPEVLQAALPWVIGISIIGSIVGGYLMTLTAAPWAAAWNMLRPKVDQAEVFA